MADKTTLIRIFHTVCTKNGVSDAEKEAIYMGFGKSSSKEFTMQELQLAIANVTGDADKWRKRVMAAIGHWLDKNKIDNNSKMIKAIACRACKTKSFNSIPLPKLRKCYYEFVRKSTVVNRDADYAEQIDSFFTTMN